MHDAVPDGLQGGLADNGDAVIDDPDLAAVVNRIKRAQGQLGGVLRMVEDGRDVESVLHQLKAVSAALGKAGFALMVSELRTVVDGTVSDDDLAQVEKLFLTLS